MEQSTKLFIALALLFILYATMKGHLSSYLALLWGNNSTSSSSGNIFGNALSTLGTNQSALAAGTSLLNGAETALKTVGVPGV